MRNCYEAQIFSIMLDGNSNIHRVIGNYLHILDK